MLVQFKQTEYNFAYCVLATAKTYNHKAFCWIMVRNTTDLLASLLIPKLRFFPKIFKPDKKKFVIVTS